MKSIWEEVNIRADRELIKVDLVKKDLRISGRPIVINGIIVPDTTAGIQLTWSDLDELYKEYKYSLPTERAVRKRKREYFKALRPDQMTDVELAIGMNRSVAKARLEVAILLGSITGDLTWQNDKDWFWSGTDPDFVILKQWI